MKTLKYDRSIEMHLLMQVTVDDTGFRVFVPRLGWEGYGQTEDEAVNDCFKDDKFQVINVATPDA